MKQFNDEDLETAARCLKRDLAQWPSLSGGRQVPGKRRRQLILEQWERQIGREVEAGLPTRESISTALKNVSSLIFQAHVFPQSFNSKILRDFSTWDVGPEYRDIDFSQEPDEFRIPFNPEDHPEELAYWLASQCRNYALTALERAIRDLDPEA